MADFFEETIKNYSGLSSETKPTTAAGNNVPNCSRWREVDTGKTFHFNAHSDEWHETDRHASFIADDMPVVDLRALSLFEQMLIALKKIEYHLYLASDTELKDQDV